MRMKGLETLLERLDRNVPTFRWMIALIVAGIITSGVVYTADMIRNSPTGVGLVQASDDDANSIAVAFFNNGQNDIVNVYGTRRGLSVGDRVELRREGPRWKIVSWTGWLPIFLVPLGILGGIEWGCFSYLRWRKQETAKRVQDHRVGE
jgi:hypothetical protein